MQTPDTWFHRQYRAHREPLHRTTERTLWQVPTAKCVQRAYRDLAEGTHTYYESPSAGSPVRKHGETVRWIVHPEAFGYRWVDWADQILGYRDRGYSTDSEGNGDRYLRAGVWRLPSRNGKAIYVGGYREREGRSDGDERTNGGGSGGACIVGDLHVGERGGNYARTGAGNREDACRDAARDGDRLAERCAEKECEYSDAYEAGGTCGRNENDLADQWREMVDSILPHERRLDTYKIDNFVDEMAKLEECIDTSIADYAGGDHEDTFNDGRSSA